MCCQHFLLPSRTFLSDSCLYSFLLVLGSQTHPYYPLPMAERIEELTLCTWYKNFHTKKWHRINFFLVLETEPRTSKLHPWPLVLIYFTILLWDRVTSDLLSSCLSLLSTSDYRHTLLPLPITKPSLLAVSALYRGVGNINWLSHLNVTSQRGLLPFVQRSQSPHPLT